LPLPLPTSSSPSVDTLPVALASFSAKEIASILSLSPLPAPPPSPTNAFADDPAAARLGQFIFFDTRLSKTGAVSCASCHDPAKNFSDGQAIPEKFSRELRHTPSLWNVAYNRWYFWDGRADSLWSQAAIPLENPIEHGTDRRQIAALFAQDQSLLRAYRQVFGTVPEAASLDGPASAADPVSRDSADRVIANVGKAIEAYERQLVSRYSPFDTFVEGIRERDDEKLQSLSPAAVRGLQTFVGRGNCTTCHHGPNFTDGEFHDTGVSRLTAASQTDMGRFGGVVSLLGSPFNSQGIFSDAGPAKDQLPTAFLVNSIKNKRQFKTPTLRNVAVTAPYMHRGQLSTLRDVVRFYSTLDVPSEPRLPFARGHIHAGGMEQVLIRLNLTDAESDDLVAFLESLSDTQINPQLMQPLASPTLD
jgi:cytochrome c peroxidase